MFSMHKLVLTLAVGLGLIVGQASADERYADATAKASGLSGGASVRSIVHSQNSCCCAPCAPAMNPGSPMQAMPGMAAQNRTDRRTFSVEPGNNGGSYSSPRYMNRRATRAPQVPSYFSSKIAPR